MTTTGDEAPASVLAGLIAASEAEVTALIDAGSGRDAEEPDRAPGCDVPATRTEPSNTTRAAFATLRRRRALGYHSRRGEQQ